MKKAIAGFLGLVIMTLGLAPAGAAARQGAPAAPQKAGLLEQGKSLYKEGRFNEAIESFQGLLRKSVDVVEITQAHVYLSYTFFTLERTDEARDNLEKAIRLRPDMDFERKDFVPEFINFLQGIKDQIVGLAFVDSIPPQAAVYIDGTKIGLAPIKKELICQKYFLRVVKPGYSAMEQAIEVKKGDPNYFKIDLAKGKNWKGFLESAGIMAALSFLLSLL